MASRIRAWYPATQYFVTPNARMDKISSHSRDARSCIQCSKSSASLSDTGGSTTACSLHVPPSWFSPNAPPSSKPVCMDPIKTRFFSWVWPKSNGFRRLAYLCTKSSRSIAVAREVDIRYVAPPLSNSIKSGTACLIYENTRSEPNSQAHRAVKIFATQSRQPTPPYLVRLAVFGVSWLLLYGSRHHCVDFVMATHWPALSTRAEGSPRPDLNGLSGSLR